MSTRRLLGAALLLATYLPLHRLLDPARAGPAGSATRAAADGAWTIAGLGTAITLGLAVVLALILPTDRLRSAATRAVDALERPDAAPFAAGTGLVALALAAAAAWLVHGGMPTSVDEMAQLLHARALAAGSLTVPTHGVPAAVVAQNGVLTGGGWASIYPPLHTLALAAGLRLGAAWLVGPVMIGLATAFASLAFERLLPRGARRTAAVLLAVSPFWILLGSTHLSHATAAATLTLVLWTALRAGSGSIGWAWACGAAIGAAVTARPWIGLATAPVLVAAVWLRPGRSIEDTRARGGGWVPRGAAVVGGGAPFALLLLLWNRALFGGSLTLGYSAAFGPAHGLGLHVDPWGNRYGAREALAYTGADVLQLGTHLLQTPLPAVALMGLGLLLARKRAGEWVFAAWIAAALAANALYWHHGLHLGPRMLFETTPAWIALFVTCAAVVGGLRSGRGAGAWLVALTVLGGAVLGPGAVRAARGDGGGAPRIEALAPPDTPAVVFVHGSWSSRIAARLAADGMRRDSIETALRRNDVCAVDRYARWRSGPPDAGPAPEVDFTPLPGSPEKLRSQLLSAGNLVRVDADGPRDPVCAREASSDRIGVQELEPVAWQVPRDGGLVLLRDLGPAANARATDLTDRPWYVFVARDDGVGPGLLDYDDGMELLWRGAASMQLR